MDRQRRLNLLALVVLVGFLSATFFHYFLGMYLNRGYPQNTFLFKPENCFMDYLHVVGGSEDLDPFNAGKFGVGGYLPFTYVVAYLLSLVRPWVLAFGLYMVGVAVYLAGYSANAIRRHGPLTTTTLLYAVILTFMAYPVLFLLDRANFDGFIFILLSLSFHLYRKERFNLSALLLAITIAMKAYTGVFIILYLADRRYRSAILAPVLVLLLTVGSLALFKDGLSAETAKFAASMTQANRFGVEVGRSVRFSSGLYTFLAVALGHGRNYVHNAVFNRFYLWGAIAAFAACCLYLDRAFWKRITVLTILMILLPWTSGDYRLVFLFIPLYLFLNEAPPSRMDAAVVLLYALLLIPKNYYVIREDLNIGMLINPPLLIALLVCVWRHRPEPAIQASPSSSEPAFPPKT